MVYSYILYHKALQFSICWQEIFHFICYHSFKLINFALIESQSKKMASIKAKVLYLHKINISTFLTDYPA